MAITAWVAQQMRIWTKVAAYRAAIQREAVARQVREEQAERARTERAQAEFEDALARGLAEENVYVPREGYGGAGLGLVSVEQWEMILRARAEDMDWGNRR